ncbi:MAG: DUF2147 domain-containing protein [Pseudomonadota bacterium]
MIEALAIAAALLTVQAPPTGRELTLEELGTWKNKSDSVHVQIKPCGEETVCGVVVWASDKAKRDAAKGGTENLVGTQILRRFREKEGLVWKGKAYVADIGKEFTGTIEPLDYNTMKVKGCVAGGLICKTQIWTRVRRNS